MDGWIDRWTGGRAGWRAGDKAEVGVVEGGSRCCLVAQRLLSAFAFDLNISWFLTLTHHY
jgi:hypothetical protein